MHKLLERVIELIVQKEMELGSLVNSLEGYRFCPRDGLHAKDIVKVEAYRDRAQADLAALQSVADTLRERLEAY